MPEIKTKDVAEAKVGNEATEPSVSMVFPGRTIKKREVTRDIKAIDKAAVTEERMRTAVIRTKDQVWEGTENQDASDESPTEYAESRIEIYSDAAVARTTHVVKTGTEKAVEKGQEVYGNHKKVKQFRRNSELFDEPFSPSTNSQFHTSASPVSTSASASTSATITSAEKGAYSEPIRASVLSQRRMAKNSIKTTEQTQRAIKQTAKSTGRAAIKTTQRTVQSTERTIKTAERASKAAIKTAEATAKASAEAAKATAKAAQKAAQISKATIKAAVEAAKVAAKAVAATVKAIVAAVKALVGAIAAGGWVAVAVILVICIIGLIVGSCFGIFFSSEDTNSGITMQQVVRNINDDYDNRLTEIKEEKPYDKLEMSGARAVWPEVLAIYAVKTTTDPNNPQEVTTLDDEKIEILTSIFWEMNSISSRWEKKEETEIKESVDEDGNIVEEEATVTTQYLYITVSHITADEMAEKYGFSDEQKKQLEELLDDKNQSLWAAVLYGIHDGDAQIVAVALSQIGNVGGQPYWSWYGFDSRVAWCACFVSWCANECGYIETGVIPKFAGCVNGVNWFRERGQWADNSIEPVPGMIIFFDWDSPNGESGPQDGLSDHVGIVEKIENGRVYTIEGNTSDSCRERSYPVGYYEILGYGVPLY